MIQFSATIRNAVGLHARPAAKFVSEAARHQSAIRMRKTGGDGNWMNAKSILSVLSLGVDTNQEIELCIEGSDEQQAAEALKNLIENNFGE